MSSHVPARRALLLVCACALLAMGCMSAAAQSGRRPPPRRPDPPPATPAPAPSPAPAEDARPKTRISISKDVLNVNFPHAVARHLVDECLARFRDVPLFAATAARDLRRSEAIDMAKEGTETHVLWLEFTSDAVSDDRAGMGSPDLRNLVVRYVLYTPGTGEVATQGRIYFYADSRTQSGRVLIPYGTRRGTGLPIDEAGRKIAEIVMDKLGAPATPPIPRR